MSHLLGIGHLSCRLLQSADEHGLSLSLSQINNITQIYLLQFNAIPWYCSWWWVLCIVLVKGDIRQNNSKVLSPFARQTAWSSINLGRFRGVEATHFFLPSMIQADASSSQASRQCEESAASSSVLRLKLLWSKSWWYWQGEIRLSRKVARRLPTAVQHWATSGMFWN